MNINRLCGFILLIIMVFIMPVFAAAEASSMTISGLQGFNMDGTIDSVPKRPQVKPADQKAGEKKQDGKKVANKPVIKEVPKATRKLKPAAVKTKIKIPVKRVKPVIKKPVRLIRNNLKI